jgi:hypothetical protein
MRLTRLKFFYIQSKIHLKLFFALFHTFYYDSKAKKNIPIKKNNESKEEFRFIYAGKDKSMKYFADHNVDQWDYNSFKEYVNTNNRHNVVESSLSNMY